MKIYYGKSESGSVSEAVKGLSSPKLIIMTSHADKFDANVEALEKAQPKDLDASEIEVRLGTTWIDKEIFQQFM